MQNSYPTRPAEQAPGGSVARLAVLSVPPALLLGASLRAEPGQLQNVFWFGTAFLGLLVALAMLAGNVRRQSLGLLLVFFYGLGIGWVSLASQDLADWYLHLTQAVMLVIPLAYFAAGALGDVGAPQLRRARLLAQRLADRKDWPADLEACRTLPEVKALREALHVDAGPALALLQHPRPQVQIAALAALDFRKHWRAGQPELILQLALRAEEPAIRAAALGSLANSEDRNLIEALAEFLRDPSQMVRCAATQAVLWDTETRWPWIRHAVRRSLGDPLCQEDGPLRHAGKLLTQEAVDDLTAWAAEKGLLGTRAALTLGLHYGQALNEGADPELISALRARLVAPVTSALLRMELARILHGAGLLDLDTLQRLLDPGNPAPLRLLAVESLLNHGETPEAVAALRELARLPNREIAMGTADVVQRKLRIEMGIVAGQPLPLVHTRQATEISRRVKAWANQEELVEEPPLVPSRLENRTWNTLA